MAFTEVRISDIRKVVLRLLDHIERDRGITSVQLSKNLYWGFEPQARFDMSRDPPEFEVGSLNDDWEFVSGLLDDSNEPVSLQLTELAPILDFIGQEIGE